MNENEHSLAIYNGRDRIGHVHGCGSIWRAFDARGSALPGEFKTSKAAVAAVNLSCPSPCVADARMDNSG